MMMLVGSWKKQLVGGVLLLLCHYVVSEPTLRGGVRLLEVADQIDLGGGQLPAAAMGAADVSLALAAVGAIFSVVGLGAVVVYWRSHVMQLSQPFGFLALLMVLLLGINTGNILASLQTSASCTASVWAYGMSVPATVTLLGAKGLKTWLDFNRCLHTDKLSSPSQGVPYVLVTGPPIVAWFVSMLLLSVWQAEKSVSFKGNTVANSATCINGDSHWGDGDWELAALFAGAVVLAAFGLTTTLRSSTILSVAGENAAVAVSTVLAAALALWRLIGYTDALSGESSDTLLLVSSSLGLILSGVAASLIVLRKLAWVHLSEREAKEIVLNGEVPEELEQRAKPRLSWVPEDGGSDLILEVNRKYGLPSPQGSVRGLSPRGDSSKRTVVARRSFSEATVVGVNAAAKGLLPVVVEVGAHPTLTREQASTRIQKTVRMSAARRVFVGLQARAHLAATKIQSAHRGTFVRANFFGLHASATKIQSLHRGTSVRRNFWSIHATHNTDTDTDTDKIHASNTDTDNDTDKKTASGASGSDCNSEKKRTAMSLSHFLPKRVHVPQLPHKLPHITNPLHNLHLKR